MPNPSESLPSGLRDLSGSLLSGTALFRRPRHPAALPMLGRLPVLFWLVELLRPRLVVQIGLGDGLVSMALCQAAGALGGQTRILGLDPGRPAGAAAALPAPFAASHDRNEIGLSVLEGADPLEAAAARHAASLAGGIDLLVLAAPLDPAQRQALAAQFLPRLSARAVILTCGAAGQGAEALFGDAPVITLPPLPSGEPDPDPDTESGAMTLILQGADQPAALRALAADDTGAPDDAADDAILRGAFLLFDALGQGLVAASAAEGLRAAHRRDAAARAEAAVLQAALHRAQARLAEISAAHSAGIARGLGGASAESGPGEGEMGARYAARLADIAALTQDFTARRDADLARISELQQQLVTTDRALQAERAEKAALARRVRAMETSTSWRLTRPVRGIRRLFSRSDPGGDRGSDPGGAR